MKNTKILIPTFTLILLLIPLAHALSITNNLQYNTSATKVNLSYDQLNRIVQKNFTGERYNYTYDQRNGTLKNITFTNGTYTYVYDDKYRVQTESRVIDGIVFNKTIIYDSSDRVIRNNFSTGEMLNYTYSNQSGINTIAGFINQTLHAINNQPTNRTYNNSLHTILVYNETSLRVTSIETGTVADIDLSQNLTYSYDNTSNILQITDNANNMTYVMTYDDLNRLTYANRTGQSVPTTYEYNYSYDSINNLLSVNGSSANII